MKLIEITTTQNVTIRYTLAPVWARYASTAIDLVILLIASLTLASILSSAFGDSPLVYYLGWGPLIIFYSLLFEIFNNGATPGKKMIGNRVIRIDGKEVKFTDYLMRWVFRSIDIFFSLSGLGLLMMLSSDKNQRLGDLLANTTVVSTSKHRRLKLSNLLKFQQLADYEPQYPQVLSLTEEDMLVLKDVLVRYHKYKNEAHKLALEAAVKKVNRKLGIKNQERDSEFLKTLIKDYVVLSR